MSVCAFNFGSFAMYINYTWTQQSKNSLLSEICMPKLFIFFKCFAQKSDLFKRYLPWIPYLLPQLLPYSRHTPDLPPFGLLFLFSLALIISKVLHNIHICYIYCLFVYFHPLEYRLHKAVTFVIFYWWYFTIPIHLKSTNCLYLC